MHDAHLAKKKPCHPPKREIGMTFLISVSDVTPHSALVNLVF
jgi:hypothetical protein